MHIYGLKEGARSAHQEAMGVLEPPIKRTSAVNTSIGIRLLLGHINCLSTRLKRHTSTIVSIRLKRQTSTAYQHGLNAKHQLLHWAYMPPFYHGLHAHFIYTAYMPLFLQGFHMPLFLHGLHASISTGLTRHLFHMPTWPLFLYGVHAPISTWPLPYTCLQGLYLYKAYTPLFIHGARHYFKRLTRRFH